MDLKLTRVILSNTQTHWKRMQNHSEKKLRQINPKLDMLVHKELQKMLATSIIAPTWHSSWLYNMGVVRKKNGEIRLCVDFRNLNILSKSNNNPLPNMGIWYKELIDLE